MQSAQPNVLTRDDTFFGVCEALGEDFGFNPFFPRVALGVLLVWNPVAAFGIYAVAGAVVALSRLLVPNRAFAEAMAGEPAAAEKALAGDNDVALDALAAAA